VKLLEEALGLMIKDAQKKDFRGEIQSLEKDSGRAGLQNGRLYRLHPFLDRDGILRVGGRVGLAPVAYEARHPAVMAPDNRLTVVYVEHLHRRLHHPGVNNYLLGATRSQFWIVHGRERWSSGSEGTAVSVRGTRSSR
jgi:hypothetical protein